MQKTVFLSVVVILINGCASTNEVSELPSTASISGEQQNVTDRCEVEDCANLSAQTPLEGKESIAQEEAAKEKTRLESWRGNFASGVTESARWIDNFFADPDFPTTDVDTRLILRQDFIKQESRPSEIKTRLNARVRLPNVSRKLSLSFSDNDNEDFAEDLPQTRVSEADDRPNLGLEFLNERTPGNNERVKLGYRFSESSYYVGSRLRRSVEFADHWQTRLSQRLRYYKQLGWESETIFELDYLRKNDYLLRQRIKTLWRDDIREVDGTQTNFSSSYIHQLSDHSAWRVVLSADYYTEPRWRWVATRFAVGYRQTIGYPWVRVELQPFVDWREETNWHPEYGVALLFNVLIED